MCRAQSVVSDSTLRIGSRHFSQSVFSHVKWPARNLSIIPPVRTTAHLGVRISSTLSWSEQLSNIIRRVKFKAFLLKRLEYAAPVWDACSQHDTIAMERFQLSIARAIFIRLQSDHAHTTLMCWPPSAGQLWPGVAVAKNCLCCGTFCTAVVLPLCAAKFLRLCLLVALTLSAIL